MSPDWHRGVGYQIFPDRFRNGDPALTPHDGAFSFRGTPIRVSRRRSLLTGARTHQHTFFGGDLAGIRQALPHLQGLGVDIVYLNPIFKSRSTHRYDTDDYFEVDPALGTAADLQALADDLHAAGMRLVLDGVFNHTSFEHPWYRGARDRHYCTRPDGSAQTWMEWGVMPKLDVQRPEVQDALLSVVDRWAMADGWRLDAAHLLPASFLRRLKERLGPDKLIIAEDWSDVSGQLRDGLYDGATNFVFRHAIERFFLRDASPETLAYRLMNQVAAYPAEGLARSWNFLDNHDTGRFLDLVDGNLDRFELAMVLLFTLPGTPFVFQGDEVGMRGADCNQSRAPMEWDRRRWAPGVYERFAGLAHLRRAHCALTDGSLHILYADNRERVLAFARRTPEERVVVAIHDGFFPHRFVVDGQPFDLAPRSWGLHVQ